MAAGDEHPSSSPCTAAGDEHPSSSPCTATVQRESAGFRKRQSGPSLSELYEKYLGGGNGIPAECPPSQPTATQPTVSTRRGGADSRFDGPDEITATSLMTEAGSEALSPARQIEEKLQRLKKECCRHVQVPSPYYIPH